MIGTFFQSLLIAYSGAVIPGPLLTYNINQSMRVGVRSGLLLISGHAILELVTIALLFLGVGAFLSTNTAQIIIGSAGGALLIIFGGVMIKDVIRGKAKLDIQGNGKEKSGGLVFNGILISAMNPYFIIWWTVVGLGLMMAAYQLYGIIGIAVFFAGHILADFSWYILISLLVSRTKKLLNEKAYMIIVAVLALVLISFGINFIVRSAGILFA